MLAALVALAKTLWRAYFHLPMSPLHSALDFFLRSKNEFRLGHLRFSLEIFLLPLRYYCGGRRAWASSFLPTQALQLALFPFAAPAT